MIKLLLKAAAILAVSELVVMFLLRSLSIPGTMFEAFLDPVLMLLFALGPLYLLMRVERKKLNKREALDNKLNSIVNDLWSASLHTLSLEVLLKKILSEIIENSPISIRRKGAIFLEEDGKLRLTASIGYSDEHKQVCGVVPPGKCLCGAVLATGETVYADSVDERHHIRPSGMLPHGHYCVPIKSGKKVIGALTLYLEPGHRRENSEERFLQSVCAIIARIIEGKKTERSLFQMQKLEAINHFAAGIAHDFNNILAAIQGYCGVVARELPSGSPQAADVREINEAAARGAALTRQLKLFSRQAKETEEVFDINPEMERIGGLIRRLMGAGIDVEFRLSASPLKVRGSRSQVEQLIMNLSVNARDAMPSGGKFIVETSGPENCCAASERSFSAAHITAEDTGEGMSAEILENIFEPFFTTKSEEKGSGLGLSIIRGIVYQYGGEVIVSSTPGKGTRFDIYLPLDGSSKPD